MKSTLLETAGAIRNIIDIMVCCGVWVKHNIGIFAVSPVGWICGEGLRAEAGTGMGTRRG